MSQLRAESARLLAVFEATGAVRVEADILQQADVLLDLMVKISVRAPM